MIVRCVQYLCFCEATPGLRDVNRQIEKGPSEEDLIMCDRPNWEWSSWALDLTWLVAWVIEWLGGEHGWKDGWEWEAVRDEICVRVFVLLERSIGFFFIEDVHEDCGRRFGGWWRGGCRSVHEDVAETIDALDRYGQNKWQQWSEQILIENVRANASKQIVSLMYVSHLHFGTVTILYNHLYLLSNDWSKTRSPCWASLSNKISDWKRHFLWQDQHLRFGVLSIQQPASAKHIHTESAHWYELENICWKQDWLISYWWILLSKDNPSLPLSYMPISSLAPIVLKKSTDWSVFWGHNASIP